MWGGDGVGGEWLVTVRLAIMTFRTVTNDDCHEPCITICGGQRKTASRRSDRTNTAAAEWVDLIGYTPCDYPPSSARYLCSILTTVFLVSLFIYARTLGTVTVDQDTDRITPEHDEFLTLLEVKLPPTELPLTVDPSPWSDKWLTPIVSEVFVRNVTAELDFLSQSWKTWSLDAIICLAKLRITGDAKQLEGKVTFEECMWVTNLQGDEQVEEGAEKVLMLFPSVGSSNIYAVRS